MGYSAVEPRWYRIVGVCGGIVVANGAVLGAIAVAGREEVDPVLGLVTLGAVIATPGVLALMGLRDRPHLWLAAAMAALPLAFLSFAGLAFPLAPVALVLWYAWSKHGVLDGARPFVPPGVLVPFLVILQLVAAAALFLSDDPASWTTADGGGSTSDVITNGEAVLGLGAIAALLVVGWLLSTPRRLVEASGPRAATTAGSSAG
jgi:hypothetical protein